MKTVDEARAEILAAFAPIGLERLPLLAALGRFLSEPVIARADSPGFDASAMDGYAVRTEDVHGAGEATPVLLRLGAESRAGSPSEAPHLPGHATRIFTGACMPAGADTVVLQEDTALTGDQVEVRFRVGPGDNVRRRGSDFAAGAPLLERGAAIGAGEVALCASQDIASVDVFRRPRVAIVSTGDELRDLGEPARPGSIVNSNAYGLAAQVLEAGAEPVVLPPVRDERAEVARAITEALTCDVVVISGGVSVGDYDVVRPALVDAGIALDFWKIKMKPGKPVSFARHGRIPVLGLPGNPVSVFVTFELFVRPGLRRMLGDPQPLRPQIPVRLAAALTRKPGRTEFARARLTSGPDGTWAQLHQHQGSGSLSSLAGVDALVVVPADAARLEQGETLEALQLRPCSG